MKEKYLKKLNKKSKKKAEEIQNEIEQWLESIKNKPKWLNSVAIDKCQINFEQN